MFERYTEKARRTIFFARYEASQLGGGAIEPKHLLLGLLREDNVLLPRLFQGDYAAKVKAIREKIEEAGGAGKRSSTAVEMPLSGEAKRVLALAREESEKLMHRHIGTEHLVLGLLRAEDEGATGVLRERGVGYDVAREALKGLYGG